MAEYTTKQVDAILDEVMSELAKRAQDEAGQKLSKADSPTDPEERSEGSSAPSDPAADEASASAGPAPDVAPPGPPAEGSAPEAPPEEASAAPEGMGMDDGSQGPDDVQALQAAYDELPDDKLRMHYMAAKAVLIARQEGQAGGAPDQGMAPAPAGPPAAPPMAAPSAPPAMKAEIKTNKQASGGQIMGKSEDASLKAEVAKLQKSLEETNARMAAEKGEYDKALFQMVEFIGRPMRKSVKDIAELKFVPKDGNELPKEDKTEAAKKLSKAEVTSKLTGKTPSLSKADKDLVLDYYEDRVDVSKIAHLLV